jgi:hypothetical protein
MRGGAVALLVALGLAAPLSLAWNDAYGAPASIMADRIASCAFWHGTFFGEQLWQSGNTIETLSHLMSASGSTLYEPLLRTSFNDTPVVVDKCV